MDERAVPVMRRASWLLALCTVALSAATATAEQYQNFPTAAQWPSGFVRIVFQQGVYPTASYSGCSDTYVRANALGGCTTCNNNYGGATTLYLSNWTSTDNNERFPLIKFDISTYMASLGYTPSNFAITSARTGLYKTSHVPGATISYTVWWQRILKPWVAGTSNGSIQFGSASYDSTGTELWTSGPQTGLDVNNDTTLAGDTSIDWQPNALSSNDWAWEDTSSVIQEWAGSDSLYNTVGRDVSAGPPISSGGLLRAFGLQIPSRLGWQFFDMTRFYQLVWSGVIQNNGVYGTNYGTGATNIIQWASSDATYKPRRPVLIIEGIYSPSSPSSVSGNSVPLGIRRR